MNTEPLAKFSTGKQVKSHMTSDKSFFEQLADY
jgi:hypothetical protein